MVLDGRWCLRLGAIVIACAPGGVVSAQDPTPGSLAAMQQTASQRTAEWNALAANLEQRVARLLPCDPQARAAIEETSRASDARTITLTGYWAMASFQSKAQVEAIRGLLAKEEGRAADWAADAKEAQLDIDLVTAQGASLATSIAQIPALVNPQKDLEAIGEQYRLLEKQAQERVTAHGRLVDDLRELLNTSQARQAAIDERQKAVGVEGQRWSAYYAARQARAQVECTLVNPAPAAGPSAGTPAVPRPAPPAKKQ